MKKILIILFSIFFVLKISACSSFYFSYNSKLLGKNFDWSFGDGYILKNQKNQKKFAYGFRSSNVASWTSKYGSITFNQNGKEFPYGGINEKGLVVEQLWFSKSQYQDNDNEEISELEWIQYQLDNHQTVVEVIENINSLTIKPIALVHYIIADKFGNSAIIEFVNGKVKINTKDRKFQVITNESLEDSKHYSALKKEINPLSRTHFDRYCILEKELNTAISLKPNDAFDFLNSVKVNQKEYKTYWTIVYDLDKADIYFQSYENQKIKKISMSDFDFNLSTEFSLLNSDEVDFKKYTSEANLKLLNEAVKIMNLDIDKNLANEHQMNPKEIIEDKIYQRNYTDLTLEFFTKKTVGNIYYMFTKGNMNDGFFQGIIPINGNITQKVFYHFPKGEFALKSFLDSNFDGEIDKNLFGMPIRTGFSNNKKKFFGMLPNYETAKILLTEQSKISINIKP